MHASNSAISINSDANASPPHKKNKSNSPINESSNVSKNPITFSSTITHAKDINHNESSAAVASAPNIEINEIDQESDKAPKKHVNRTIETEPYMNNY